MANNRAAMADLQRILKVHEPLYQRADIQMETTALQPGAAVDLVLNFLRDEGVRPDLA